MNNIYEEITKYKRNYGGIAWRVKSHASVIERHLNPGEEILYVFAGQKNNHFYDIFRTAVVALTNKRIIIGQKRLFFGYFLTTITPDLFNDLEIYRGLIWGKVTIDTIKEEVVLTNVSKRALVDIETNITEFMMTAKQKYNNGD